MCVIIFTVTDYFDCPFKIECYILHKFETDFHMITKRIYKNRKGTVEKIKSCLIYFSDISYFYTVLPKSIS